MKKGCFKRVISINSPIMHGLQVKAAGAITFADVGTVRNYFLRKYFLCHDINGDAAWFIIFRANSC